MREKDTSIAKNDGKLEGGLLGGNFLFQFVIRLLQEFRLQEQNHRKTGNFLTGLYTWSDSRAMTRKCFKCENIAKFDLDE